MSDTCGVLLEPMEPVVIECCNFCGRESVLQWDVKKDGYAIYCPFCGVRLMLCSECLEQHGECETSRCIA